MLEQIDALPSPKGHPPRGDRNGKLRLREGGSDMRGHVVQTFGFVDIALAVFGHNFLEKIFKVRLNVGIGIFLNEQRGRGVAAENRQEAGRDILLAKPARYLRADLDETFAAGLNV